MEQKTKRFEQYKPHMNLQAVLSANGRFIYISANCKELLSYEQNELIGTYLKDYLHDTKTSPPKSSKPMSICKKNTAKIRQKRTRIFSGFFFCYQNLTNARSFEGDFSHFSESF
ncbi:hypothetical protein DT075_21805 [Bacillus licheniformis]|nr:hypothetical protein DT075_21805 [Bacillus licheniformis]